MILVLGTFGFVGTLAYIRMPRTRVRRTGRGPSQEVMEVAAAEVMKQLRASLQSTVYAMHLSIGSV